MRDEDWKVVGAAAEGEAAEEVAAEGGETPEPAVDPVVPSTGGEDAPKAAGEGFLAAEELLDAAEEAVTEGEEAVAGAEDAPAEADDTLAATGDDPAGPDGTSAATENLPTASEESLSGEGDDLAATGDPSTAEEPPTETTAEADDTFGEAEAAELVAALASARENEPTVEEEALAQAEAEKIDEEDNPAPAEIEEPEEEPDAAFEKLAARARRLDDDQVQHILHSLLFVADRPLTIDAFRQATGLEAKRIRTGLDTLSGILREGISGVVLSEVAGGWQLRTAPESAEYVRRFLQVKPRRLTRAALETLAIVAYRQPVTRPEIEEIRGVDCGAVLRALLDWKLIKILGKKDEVGRPLLYGTTREFLEFFQLKDLASLPTLREFHELNEESRQIMVDELGPEAVEEVGSIEGMLGELADPEFAEAERRRAEKSEAALAELEQAVADAESSVAAATEALDEPSTQEPSEEGDISPEAEEEASTSASDAEPHPAPESES